MVFRETIVKFLCTFSRMKDEMFLTANLRCRYKTKNLIMKLLPFFVPSCKKCLSLLLLLTFSVYAFAQSSRVKKAVFIIVDGVAADLMEKLPVPNLHAIAKEGGYTRAYVGGIKGTYSETPTISAVGYNSVLTGTWVNKHNVWDNDIAAPNYNYYTIFRYCKMQYPQKKTAIFSSWQDNRTKLVGDNFPATGNIPVDYHYDGLELDTVNFPQDKKRDFMSKIDESVATHAADYIRQNAPDLSWVYLEYTDDMGHMHGDGPDYYNAIALADKRVGYVWEAIQYREKHFNEDWLIIVTTDHGRDAKTGQGHGGQSDRERGSWIFTNAKNLNAEFHQPQASVVDIMPSLARFMNIAVPEENNREVDGIPFTGKVSFTQPAYSQQGSVINISWKAQEPTGDIKIWGSATNNFKTGSKDEYQLLKTVSIADQKATIHLPAEAKGFYKIFLQAKDNSANYWIASPKK